MAEIQLGSYPQPSILKLYSDREHVQLDPDYQRQSQIWSLEKKQLLIDSVLNGFDIPKFYLHEFTPPRQIGGKTYTHAIIDGKQRLEAFWAFMEGDFPLDESSVYLPDPNVKLGGLTYRELGREYPLIRSLFEAHALDVVTIRTDDIELIEDMFSRLNEAVALNAPEKRNAFGGALPLIIRNISRHSFFAKKLPFPNTRYRHLDLATKFLLIESEGNFVDTKKRNLDEFVKEYRGPKKKAHAKDLGNRCEHVLDLMMESFIDSDLLLRSIGMITLYFYAFKFHHDGGSEGLIGRTALVGFEAALNHNRQMWEDDPTMIDKDLTDFDDLIQSVNDRAALRRRFEVLATFLSSFDDLVISAPER